MRTIRKSLKLALTAVGCAVFLSLLAPATASARMNVSIGVGVPFAPYYPHYYYGPWCGRGYYYPAPVVVEPYAEYEEYDYYYPPPAYGYYDYPGYYYGPRGYAYSRHHDRRDERRAAPHGKAKADSGKSAKASEKAKPSTKVNIDQPANTGAAGSAKSTGAPQRQ